MPFMPFYAIIDYFNVQKFAQKHLSSNIDFWERNMDLILFERLFLVLFE